MYQNLLIHLSANWHLVCFHGTSLVAQMAKSLPTMWETWVQPLGWENLLEKKMTTHSNILAWKIPWTEEPGRLQSMGSQRVRHDWTTSPSPFLIFHCVYVPLLSYPFICWWTSRLLPCPGYYKQCCDEYWGTCASFNSGFLSVYAQQWDCWIIRQFYFQFFKESPHCSP